MSNPKKISKQKAARRRQLKDLETKALLSQQALEDAQAEDVTPDAPSADWLSPESKAAPNDAFIQRERLLKDDMPMGYQTTPMAMEGGNEMWGAEIVPPYGGATTMQAVMDYQDAMEKAESLDDLVDTYQTVLSNIMAANDIADKGSAIASAASELQKLMAGMKERKALAESKASDKPDRKSVV